MYTSIDLRGLTILSGTRDLLNPPSPALSKGNQRGELPNDLWSRIQGLAVRLKVETSFRDCPQYRTQYQYWGSPQTCGKLLKCHPKTCFFFWGGPGVVVAHSKNLPVEMAISWGYIHVYPLVSSNMASWNIPYRWSFLWGKSVISGPFSIVVFDYRRVCECIHSQELWLSPIFSPKNWQVSGYCSTKKGVFDQPL